MSYDFHPHAGIFPLLDGEEFRALVEDIRENGQREPITIHDNMILDGRNRYNACLAAGIEPWVIGFRDGEDPLAFVISVNLHRRHLDESQRAMVAARIATLPLGANQHRVGLGAPIGAPSQPAVAATLKASRRSVQRARVVLDHGTPDLVAAADQGDIPVSQAAAIAREEPSVQRNIVAKVKDGIRPQEARRLVKAERAAAREAAHPSGRYRVIYADPPWSYGNTQPDYHPEQRDHYPVMSLSEICEMPVRDWVMDDAVLFLWVTSPILEDAFKVVAAWGFKYKASFVWDKVLHNMGHYNSVRHELLLVCTRGSCQPDVRRLFDSVVVEERTVHSRKPVQFYEMIETLYTTGPYLELFARSSRDGWHAFGNEVIADVA